MKEKQVKYRSRREKAIRRAALLLALVLACLVLGNYNLSPRGGIRASEEVVHLGRTEVVRSIGSLGLKGSGLSRGYLCANENGMLFALIRYYWAYGWADYGFAALDCSGPEEVHGATYSVSKRREGEDNWRWFTFGRIDEADGALLRAEMGGYDETGLVWLAAQTVDIPRSQWIQKDGRTYFLQELPRYEPEEGRAYRRVRLTLLDEAGNILYQDMVTQGGSTSLG